MRHGPGKFEACGNYALVSKWLYETAEYGTGSVDELGWFDRFDGMIKGKGPFYAIVSESSQGFVNVVWYDTEEELDEDWEAIETMYTNFYEEQENNENEEEED